MVPISPGKVVDSVQGQVSKAGLGHVKNSDVTTAAKTFEVLPEKESVPIFEVKGLAQKLYMAMARGLVYSSRRSNGAIRGIAATIGNLFVSHLKAAESLWSKNVATIEERDVCAAWDYVRRIMTELRSILFC